ncbi:hypothetical protein RLT85_14770 [Mesonia ostreae]|uniref:Uncharacterized protein n=2 Tax=Mesonia ostreae TaxID=861110 RepID=A0ABU2KME4_9FLAO|nr:hypothetical protein [Mesonia ostreae]MDT0295893.1 hypothetical protein [Mesonia ostreae]
MIKIHKNLILVLLLIFGFSALCAQEIRKIEGFYPKLNFNMEGNATYWFLVNNIAWGCRSGL